MSSKGSEKSVKRENSYKNSKLRLYSGERSRSSQKNKKSQQIFTPLGDDYADEERDHVPGITFSDQRIKSSFRRYENEISDKLVMLNKKGMEHLS